LTTLVKGLCLNGEVYKSLHFHDEVLKKGFQLNHVSYRILINGLCKMEQTIAALQLTIEMTRRGSVKLTDVVADTVTDAVAGVVTDAVAGANVAVAANAVAAKPIATVAA
jgi:pentatricopeptide repeat protein